MKRKSPDLEARANALLKRLQRHNLGKQRLTELEIRSVIKDIQAIKKLNLSESLSSHVLERVDSKMKQAVAEASKLIAGLKGETDWAANDF